MRFFFLLLFLSTASFCAQAQADTLGIVDSAQNVQLDSTVIPKESNSSIVQKKRVQASNSKNSGGLFFIGLGTFLLFGLLRFFYNKYINDLFNALTKSTLWRLSANDRLWQNQSRRVLFMLLYFLSCGFVVGQFIGLYAPALTVFQLWMYGSLVTAGVFLFKYLVLQSVALVFRFKKVADAYFKHITVINQVFGLILLPICGILLLLPARMRIILIIISGIMVAISLIFKFLINIAYVRNLSKVNYMHFMVYLCTLELIPLAVLARFVFSRMGA